MTTQPLPRGSTIGILGDGQLGRMLIMFGAAKLGLKTVVWGQSHDSPAMQIATYRIVAPFDDPQALTEFCALADVVTIEFENVPVSLVEAIEAKGIPMRPSSRVLAIAQDRVKEKSFFRESGFPSPYTVFLFKGAGLPELQSFNFPGVLKTARNGYDGKGQQIVSEKSDLLDAWQALGGVDCVLEEKLNFAYEASIIVASNGVDIVTYTPIQNVHVNGILHQSSCPGTIEPAVQDRCRDLGVRVAKKLELSGLIAVELFVMSDGSVLLNEIAPRPHNSGHGTIEGCVTNQFEQCIRASANWPLMSTQLRSPWTMTNVLGEDISVLSATKTPRVSVHDYGKPKPTAGRKMGHITQLGSTSDLAS
jgi:5-(carboxyamino)imidazole ribonucleotide synthase